MIATVIFADLVVLVVAWFAGEGWIVNTQVGFWSSALVMGASMFSYAQMVRGRLAQGDVAPSDDRDTIDTLEDPFDLYSETSEETESSESESADAETIKATIREEKARLKSQHRSVGQTLRDARPFMSLYRLGAYGVLVFGFLYLQANGLLAPLPYLIGLGVPVAVSVGVLTARQRSVS
jgi:fatty acid desaturase